MLDREAQITNAILRAAQKTRASGEPCTVFALVEAELKTLDPPPSIPELMRHIRTVLDNGGEE